MIAKTYSTATSGTITLLDTKQDQVFVHNAASLAATLTVTMPANPIDGQCVTVCSTLGVTALTISSGLTIVGTLTVLAAAGFWTMCYESTANKWFRTG
jgi:hypothetical protein